VDRRKGGYIDPMPTDYQIIDGFEKLRAAFLDANPAIPHGERAALEDSRKARHAAPSRSEVLEA
jgi:hypothetical protein